MATRFYRKITGLSYIVHIPNHFRTAENAVCQPRLIVCQSHHFTTVLWRSCNWGCSLVGTASGWHAADAGLIPRGGKGFFLPESAFSADSLTVFVNPHVQSHAFISVVNVRIWCIMETLKHPACTIGWVAQLCCSWLSPEMATRISHGRNPIGTIQLLKVKVSPFSSSGKRPLLVVFFLESLEMSLFHWRQFGRCSVSGLSHDFPQALSACNFADAMFSLGNFGETAVVFFPQMTKLGTLRTIHCFGMQNIDFHDFQEQIW